MACLTTCYSLGKMCYHSDQSFCTCRHILETTRSSHRRSSMKKGALKNFARFTGKHLCHLFFKSLFSTVFICLLALI